MTQAGPAGVCVKMGLCCGVGNWKMVLVESVAVADENECKEGNVGLSGVQQQVLRSVKLGKESKCIMILQSANREQVFIT